MRLRLVILVALLVGVFPGPGIAARAATCSAEEKAANQAALASYTKRISAERKAYFRTHKRAAQRRAFIKKQQATLRRLRAAAACTVASTGPVPPTPVTPPPMSTATFLFGSGVSAADEVGVRDGVALAFTALGKLGVQAVHPFTVTLDPQPGFEMTGPFAVHLSTTALGWPHTGATFREVMVAHEVWHVVQASLVQPRTFIDVPDDAVPTGGPRWLIEGSAEVFAYHALADAGQLDYATQCAVYLSGARQATQPLRSMESWAGMVQAKPFDYALGFNAADYIARTFGEAQFIAYWKAIGAGSSWQDAFRAAFGKSIAQFYDDFGRYRPCG